jgi:hypothetical protein
MIRVACAGAAAVALLAVAPAADAPAGRRAPAPRLPARFKVLAHVNPGGGYSADVVAHDGYAYLSSRKGAMSCPALGVRVYDLRVPSKPRRLSTFAAAATDSEFAGTSAEKTIVSRIDTPAFSGVVAATSIQACKPGDPQGFSLYDVTDPASPRKLAFVRTEPLGAHELWLQAARGGAWVYIAVKGSEAATPPGMPNTPGPPDFRIFDVGNPARPVEVGGWSAWRDLGIRPVVGKVFLGHSVITNADATRAYLSYWDLGTVLLDISDPSHPHYLGRTTGLAPQGAAHSAAVALSGKLLIETHETSYGRATFIDISNPSRPRRLSELVLPKKLTAAGARAPRPYFVFADSVHDPKVAGKVVFFSWYRQGVLAVDFKNPRRPRILARFLPKPVADPEELLCEEHACRAVWGVYVTANYVLASDMAGGLWVLRLARGKS